MAENSDFIRITNREIYEELKAVREMVRRVLSKTQNNKKLINWLFGLYTSGFVALATVVIVGLN